METTPTALWPGVRREGGNGWVATALRVGVVLADGSRSSGPNNSGGLPVWSAVAGDGVQGQIDAIAVETSIDPSDRLIRRKIVAESGKVDEFDSLPFADIPNMGMAVEDGFHLAMGADDFKQAARVEQIAIAFPQRVVHEENGRLFRVRREIFDQPCPLVFAQQSGGFVHIEAFDSCKALGN